MKSLLSRPVFELDNILDTPQPNSSILDRIEATNCQDENDDVFSPSLLQVSVCDKAFDSQLSMFDCESQPDITFSDGLTNSNKRISDSEPVYPEKKKKARVSKKMKKQSVNFNFQDQFDFDSNPLNPIIVLDARLTELSKMISNCSNKVFCQSVLTFRNDLQKYVNIVIDEYRTLRQQLMLASDPGREFELHSKIKLKVIQQRRIIPIFRRSKELLRLVSQHQKNRSVTSTESQTQEGTLNPTVVMVPVVEVADTGCQADRLTSGELDTPKCKIESIPTVSQLIGGDLIKIGSDVLSYEYLGFVRLASILANGKIKCSANNRVYANEINWINSFLVGSVKNVNVYEMLKYKDENWNQFEMFVGMRQKENETSETTDLNDCSVKPRVAPKRTFLLNKNSRYWPAVFE